MCDGSAFLELEHAGIGFEPNCHEHNDLLGRLTSLLVYISSLFTPLFMNDCGMKLVCTRSDHRPACRAEVGPLRESHAQSTSITSYRPAGSDSAGPSSPIHPTQPTQPSQTTWTRSHRDRGGASPRWQIANIQSRPAACAPSAASP